MSSSGESFLPSRRAFFSSALAVFLSVFSLPLPAFFVFFPIFVCLQEWRLRAITREVALLLLPFVLEKANVAFIYLGHLLLSMRRFVGPFTNHIILGILETSYFSRKNYSYRHFLSFHLRKEILCAWGTLSTWFLSTLPSKYIFLVSCSRPTGFLFSFLLLSGKYFTFPIESDSIPNHKLFQKLFWNLQFHRRCFQSGHDPFPEISIAAVDLQGFFSSYSPVGVQVG